MATQTLKDGSIITLYYLGRGATAQDVIWVTKSSKNKKKYIGKFKWFDDKSSKINIWQINDTLIKIRLTDTTIWKGVFTDFTINLNNKIETNDGSLYADSSYR